MNFRRIDGMLPDTVRAALAELGSDISAARRLRRMSQEGLAKRIGVARATVVRMEAGNPNVAIGTIAAAAWVMGLEANLAGAFSTEKDPVALRAARLDLPERIHERNQFDDGPSLDF